MVLNKNDVKRLIIYFIYDKDGIVDDYIIYMLNALRQNASEIVAVVNGTLENKSKDKLLSITNNEFSFHIFFETQNLQPPISHLQLVYQEYI